MIARPVLIAALLASASAAVPARAQDKQDRKDAPFTLQQALGDSDGLTISGSVRGRYEVLGNQFRPGRSEEHTSELQPLMRLSYAVLCWKNKQLTKQIYTTSERE